MSEQNPYEQLGVTENSSFDEIQAARNRLCAQCENDQKQVAQIEAAYDAVLMDRLRLRQEGRIKVPDRIRFPEKRVDPPSSPTAPSQSKAPQWLQRFIDTPSQADILLPAGVMSALIALVIFTPPASLSMALQLALVIGLGAAFYFLFRKEKKLGRTVLLGFVGLTVGLLCGLVVDTLLGAAGVHLPISQPAIETAVALFVLWLISSFLR